MHYRRFLRSSFWLLRLLDLPLPSQAIDGRHISCGRGHPVLSNIFGASLWVPDFVVILRSESVSGQFVSTGLGGWSGVACASANPRRRSL